MTNHALEAEARQMIAALRAIREDLKALGLWNYYDDKREQGLSGACTEVQRAIESAETIGL